MCFFYRMFSFGMPRDICVGGLASWVKVPIAEAKGLGWRLSCR